MYHVYILRCAGNSLYVGQTRNIARRLYENNAGSGAAFTFKRRPVRLAYSEPYPTRTAAVRRERQLKRWTRSKKDALIRGGLVLLRRLSKRRS